MGARLILLYARSRGLAQSLLAIAVFLLVGVLLSPVARLDVILWQDVVVDTADLIGVVPVVLLAPGFARSLGEAELARIGRLRALRTLHVAAGVAGVAVACSVVVASMRQNAAMLPAVGNGFAFLGLLLASQARNLPLPSWTIPVTLAMAMYFLGTNPTTRHVHSWAWLLSSDLGVRMSVNLALLLLGGGWFILGTRLPSESLEE